MAKKKHKKKHSFQHKNVPTPVAAASSVATRSGVVSKSNTMPNEWVEVRDDVKKTIILAIVFITLMIGLWLLFENTSVGPNLYNSIKL